MSVKRWIKKIASLYEDTDARRHARIPADFEATLSGPFGMLSVTGVDANRDGAGVQAATPVATGTLVFITINGLGLMGFAHVRRCSARGEGYLLGLEFRERLARHHRYDSMAVGQVPCDERRVWDEADVF